MKRSEKAPRTPVEPSGATQAPVPDLAAQLAQVTAERDALASALLGVGDAMLSVRDKINRLVARQ
jgi:hypothetical protein